MPSHVFSNHEIHLKIALGIVSNTNHKYHSDYGFRALSNDGVTTIQLSKATKERLDMIMPKAWTYDRIVAELCEIWEKEKKSIGKSSKAD